MNEEYVTRKIRLHLNAAETVTALEAGQIYALIADDDRLTNLLLWSTLLNACADGEHASLVAAYALDRSLPEPALHPLAFEAMESGLMRTFDVKSDGTVREPVVHTHQLLNDLQHWKANSGPLLIIDGAEQLYWRQDAASFELWSEWALRHRSAVFFIFRQSGLEAGVSAMTLLPPPRAFSGLAQLVARPGGTEWQVFHWFSEAGLIAGQSYPLRVYNDRLEILEQENHDFQAAPAADESQVFIQRSALQPKETAPEAWTIIGDHPEEIHEATAGAIAATLVLAFHSGTDFLALARSIYNLRRRNGTRLKIVVRELNARLRYSQESMVIRIGANLVTPAEIAYARFLGMVAMTQGQRYPHRLPPSFEDGSQEALPEHQQGYLPPHEFTSAVLAIQERSRSLQIQNVLLRLPLAYGLFPLDALRYCGITRTGDLCSADNGTVYLFLYACREMDVDRALDRVFGLPIDELFSSDERYLSIRGIQDVIADFDARNRARPFPDLSADLGALGIDAPVAIPAEAPAQDKKGPSPKQYPAPALAVNWPLPIKGQPKLTDVSVVTQ